MANLTDGSFFCRGRGAAVNGSIIFIRLKKTSHVIFTYVLPILLPLCFFWFDYLDQRSELLKGRNWWGDDVCFKSVYIHTQLKISFLNSLVSVYVFLSSVAFFYLHKNRARHYWLVTFLSFCIAGWSTNYYWCWS